MARNFMHSKDCRPNDPTSSGVPNHPEKVQEVRSEKLGHLHAEYGNERFKHVKGQLNWRLATFDGFNVIREACETDVLQSTRR